MTTKTWSKLIGMIVVASGALLSSRIASADEATVTVGQRFADPPREPAPIAAEDPRLSELPRDLRRSPVRLALGPKGVTTGKGLGLGVGLAADFGTGSVGARLAAAWVRGEGKSADGTSTPTGDAIGQYTGELTLDAVRRGPLHPIVGMGAGLLRVSRPDASGYAGVGTGRLGLEYALALEDADVRVGADVTGALVGPVDEDVNNLRAYCLVGAHLAIGF